MHQGTVFDAVWSRRSAAEHIDMRRGRARYGLLRIRAQELQFSGEAVGPLGREAVIDVSERCAIPVVILV